MLFGFSRIEGEEDVAVCTDTLQPPFPSIIYYVSNLFPSFFSLLEL